MQAIQAEQATRILSRQVGREISAEEINEISGARWVPLQTTTVTPTKVIGDADSVWVY